jgi:hemolysin activation/secretion protein
VTEHRCWYSYHDRRYSSKYSLPINNKKITLDIAVSYYDNIIGI